ncbi:MAG: acylneuraminate cytidylyltransferase family protein [Bacteroidetes bacterium]|nr:acylneuraminate cytidylyltransferase family protein [Bacteroidota bacterium]
MIPLVIIPARAGSKGVPRKNIKCLANKPLIQYTIEAAREVFSDKEICVSTDDIEIVKLVENLEMKVPFFRPKELATDTASSYEVLLHAIDYYEKNIFVPDTIILLQPTSPYRRGVHIKEALKLFDSNCEMLVSVKETKANPYYTLREENKKGFLEISKKSTFTRRQDCPKVYEVNGAIYIIDVLTLKKKSLSKIRKVRKYIMDELSSIDIDTQFDWKIAEFMKKEFERKINQTS